MTDFMLYSIVFCFVLIAVTVFGVILRFHSTGITFDGLILVFVTIICLVGLGYGYLNYRNTYPGPLKCTALIAFIILVAPKLITAAINVVGSRKHKN